MTKYYCDLCNQDHRLMDLVRLSILDGVHPHNGSTSTRVIDVCTPCLYEITRLGNSPLEVNIEYADLKKKIK